MFITTFGDNSEISEPIVVILTTSPMWFKKVTFVKILLWRNYTLINLYLQAVLSLGNFAFVGSIT